MDLRRNLNNKKIYGSPPELEQQKMILTKLKEVWSGIESLTTVKNTLANSLEDNFGELCIKLKSIHTKFMSQARQILLVCEQRDMIEFTENIKNHALGKHQFDLSSGKIELDLEAIQFKLDIKEASLFLETDKPKIYYRNILIPSNKIKVYLEFLSIIKYEVK